MRTTPSVEESGGTRRRWCSTCRSFSWRSSRPSRRDMTGAGGAVHGPVGWELVAILWGTTIGLALAHWLAFRLATQGLRQGPLAGWDRLQALSALAGGAFVAAMASMPVLLFSDELEQPVVPFVLALIIGGVCYLVERASQRSRATSLVFGVFALVLGLAVGTLKSGLLAHLSSNG